MKIRIESSRVCTHQHSTYGPLRGNAFAAVTALVLLLSTMAVRATIIPAPPTRTASSGTINNAFDDNNATSWISNSEGTNTTAQFQFSGPTEFDRVVFINHIFANDGEDVTSQINLSFDGGTASQYSIHAIGDRMTGNILDVGPITATTVDLKITQVLNGSVGDDVGAGEIFFVRPPPLSGRIANVSVIGFSSEFLDIGPATNLLNLRLGSGRPTDSTSTYGSFSDGTNTFVDFDLGSLLPVTGFDFFDRTRSDTAVGSVTGFNMIFSLDTTFDSNDVTLSYSKLGSEIGVSDEFGAIMARYVRYDVTGLAFAELPNVGGSNFTFYTPEPSTSMLLAVSGLLLWRRRGRTRNLRD